MGGRSGCRRCPRAGQGPGAAQLRLFGRVDWTAARRWPPARCCAAYAARSPAAAAQDPGPTNGVVASVPGHPLWLKVLELMRERVEEDPQRGVVELTGGCLRTAGAAGGVAPQAHGVRLPPPAAAARPLLRPAPRLSPAWLTPLHRPGPHVHNLQVPPGARWAQGAGGAARPLVRGAPHRRQPCHGLSAGEAALCWRGVRREALRMREAAGGQEELPHSGAQCWTSLRATPCGASRPVPGPLLSPLRVG